MGQDRSFKCGGACCRSFDLPYSPEELQRAADTMRRLGTPDHPDWPIDVKPLTDIEQIADMLIYLGEFAASPQPMIGSGSGKACHYYTCKNLQSDGLCGIYADRPGMCRFYPYEGKCHYAECQASCKAAIRTAVSKT